MQDDLIERLEAKERRFWVDDQQPAYPDSIFGEAAEAGKADNARIAALTAIMGAGDGVQEWECFCDASYFDMWCVREVGERRFGHGFHLAIGDEAQGLCDHLNEQARHRSTAAAAERARIVAWLRGLSTATLTPGIVAFFGDPWGDDGQRLLGEIADAIERGEV